MNGFRKILVPVDFSAHSRRALETAIWLAEQSGAEVHVLHVGPQPGSYAPLDRWIWGDERSEHDLARAFEQAERSAFDAFWKNLPAEVRTRCTERLEHGPPVDVITGIAKTDAHDLIVMGTHGRTGAQHLLMGSVAERVTRHAACAVMVVP